MTSTPQLDFWRGDFGASYITRNPASATNLRARVALWAEILKYTLSQPPRSILEVGANVGINLRALRTLTDADFYALEPNDTAREILQKDGVVAPDRLVGGMASDIGLPDGVADLAFTSGVLIHIHPRDLEASIREIHRCSRRWIACIEYFSDTEEQKDYFGEKDRLFKRDFGGFWLDTFPDLKIAAYGFAWKRVTGLDNLTWWLFRKD